MKKIILAGVLLAATALPAKAEEVTGINPYIGIDLAYTDVNYDNGLSAILDDSLLGGNIYAGIRPHMNWGIEAGYFRTQEGKKTTALTQSKVKLWGLTLDAMGYLPLSDDNRFELLGSAGAVYAKAKVEGPGGSASDNDTEWRLGLGAQYHVTDAVGFRAMAHYQPADFDDTVDHLITYSVGVNYSF